MAMVVQIDSNGVSQQSEADFRSGVVTASPHDTEFKFRQHVFLVEDF